MASLCCCCSNSSSSSSNKCEPSRYLVLPSTAPDEDESHEAFRASLFLSLGIDINICEAPPSCSTQAGVAASLSDRNIPVSGTRSPLRLLKLCCCLCSDCVRVNCGIWLDALRVHHASDSELYFFQAHLQRPQNTTEKNESDTAAAAAERDGAARKRKKSMDCFRLARGRTPGSREEAWGLLAGCSGPFSFRHCLTIMQRPAELLLRNSHGEWETEPAAAAAAAAAAYATQAHRLFALFCAPANELRPYTPEEEQTTVLRTAAAELQAYVHPKVQVASFKQEGRGLVAAEGLKRGEVLLRVPASALLNVYTALTHTTFSPLAQLLLGLPAERLLQQQEGATQQAPQQQQKKPDLPTELQPLVDSDVVLCLFLLFLAFTGGEQGGRTLLRFLPAAGEADAVATAEAVCRSSAGDVAAAAGAAAAAAAAAAEKEELLLMDSEGVVEFLGDAALTSGVSRSLAKCKMMQQELLPLLQQTFPPPAGMQQGGGVLSACRAAAAAAATRAASARFDGGMPAGAVAAAAAAQVCPASQGLSPLSCEGTDILKAFLAQLNYTDFLWAHLILESRSFSLPVQPRRPLQEYQPAVKPVEQPLGGSTGKSSGAPPVEGPPGGPPKEPLHGKGEEENREDEQEDEEEEEEPRVPFLPELLETHAAQECRRLLLPVGGPVAPTNEKEPPSFVRLPPRCASFVPLGDLLNHHFHAQVLSPVLEEETGNLCLRLACDVPAGAQVYVHYGPLQSWQFLAYFGFCPSSFPRLQPPQRETTDKADTHGEWQFTGEANGNPVDFLTVQVDVPEDDAEYELKKNIMELQDLPLCGLFSTGMESFSWRFLASLFVSSHDCLDHFLCAGGAGAAAPAAAAASAAVAAGESPWGPTYTFTAVSGDPEAASRIREIIAGALQSVAKAAEDRTALLDKWTKDTQAAPRWVRVWGEKLRIYLNNQRALASTQMAALTKCLPFCPSSSVPPSVESAARAEGTSVCAYDCS